MKAAIPHVMKSADKKELEPVTPSSTVTLNPPSATRSRNLPVAACWSVDKAGPAASPGHASAPMAQRPGRGTARSQNGPAYRRPAHKKPLKNAKNCLFVRVRECISGPPRAGLIVTPLALEVI